MLITKLPRVKLKMNAPTHTVLKRTHAWILRSDVHAVRDFMLGIIKRVPSLDILHQTARILSSLLSKDYIYARSQSNSSCIEMKEFVSCNMGMIQQEEISSIYEWFTNSDNMKKKHFILQLVRMVADPSILYDVCQLCQSRCCELKRHEEIISEVTGSGDHQTYIPTSNSVQFSHLNFVESSLTVPDDKYGRLSNIPSSTSSSCFIIPCVDFISKLPVHLAKQILSCLNSKDLSSSSCVSNAWNKLTHEVKLENYILHEMKEESILMQGVSAKGIQANFAKKRTLMLPVVSEQDETFISEGDLTTKKLDFDFTDIGLPLTPTLVEERNIFCGAYNVLVVNHHSDRHRVIDYDGGNSLIMGSNDRTVKIIDIRSGQLCQPPIQGHPGYITTVHMKKNNFYSGSYDTTIRCWGVGSSGCKQILTGHRKSIVSIDSCENILVSGSKDGRLKAWDLSSGKCKCTFKHSEQSILTCVKILGDIVISSCDRGKVKVWDLSTRKLVKTLRHRCGINSVCCDAYYIITAGDDGYALAWVKPGKVKKCLKSYRHPRKVLCVALSFQRLITGCEDGKLRVIHLQTGECMRALRGNSNCDPILSLCCYTNNLIGGDRIVVNTTSNILLLQFEPISWNYEAQDNKEDEKLFKVERQVRPLTCTQYPYTRACRSRLSLSSATSKTARSTSGSRPNTACSATFQSSWKRPQSCYTEPRSVHSRISSRCQSSMSCTSSATNTSKY
nr:F-box/WD repeat-containing protein 10-like [Ciona intestinalis]|eukprot:XP_018668012.1 F-box/WD repeat-containing protein 10-like [Ciona intestinalis]